MQELRWIPMPIKPFRLEKEFTTFFAKQLKEKWFFWHKISDLDIRAKPVDSIIRTHLESYFCEIKVIKKDEFSFDQFQPNQIKALEEISKLWWKAIVVIYSVEYNSYIVEDFSELKNKYSTKRK